jgi:cell division protein ZapA
LAQVSVSINGRQYRMACEDGQEDHLMELAAEVNRRIHAMRAEFGEVGDMRLTIMASITIADEMAEITNRVKQLELQLGELNDARLASTDRTRAAESAFVEVLATTAERIEKVAKRLNQQSAAGRA